MLYREPVQKSFYRVCDALEHTGWYLKGQKRMLMRDLFAVANHLIYFCYTDSKRRKRRGLAVAGDMTSRDGKKTQAAGRVGDASGKDKTGAVRKSHDVDNAKSAAAAVDATRSETALPDQPDAANVDDRYVHWHAASAQFTLFFVHSFSPSTAAPHIEEYEAHLLDGCHKEPPT